jgi:chemotaxis signal transduction protein
VRSIIRRGEEILPVFDLAGRLNVTVRGSRPLYLIVRHHDGALAICIDEEIPSLHTVDPALIHTRQGEAGQVGTCEVGSETVPIYALSKLTGSES